MHTDFSFSEEFRFAGEDPKPLHHLPRRKNSWNPKILTRWWFWPAGVGGLLALNLAVDLLSRISGW